MSRVFELDESRPITEIKFRKTGGSLSVIWPSANAAVPADLLHDDRRYEASCEGKG